MRNSIMNNTQLQGMNKRGCNMYTTQQAERIAPATDRQVSGRTDRLLQAIRYAMLTTLLAGWMGSTWAATATTTTLMTTPNPVVVGDEVTLTATVTGVSSPTGTVTFKNGTTVLGTVTLSEGQAVLNRSFSSVGTKSLKAVYSGDTNNLTSTSAVVAQVVNRTPTTTNLSTNPNPSAAGGTVKLTATVTGVSPTGSVTFKQGTTVLGTIALSAGQAALNHSFGVAGTKSLTAVYGGDTDNLSSTSVVVSQTVQALTTTTLTTTPNPSVAGGVVTMTATVTGNAPTGNVTFKSGTTVLGTSSLGAGQATFSYTFTVVGSGTRNLTAVYEGDANNPGSTSAIKVQTVNKAPTTTLLSSTPNPSALGEAVALTATVTGASPTGTVTFKSGTTALGTATLADGQAVLSRTFSTVGAKNLTVVYSGDTNNGTSTSAILVQTVKTVASLSLNVTPTTLTVGQGPVLTASVTGNAPTGTVTVKDVATDTVLGTAALAAGQATLNLPPYGTAGSYNLNAVYSGDSNNTPASATAASINVIDAPAVMLTAPLNNTVATAPGSFTLAADASSAGTITQIEFYANDGSVNTLIGTDTTAPYTLNWSNVPAGSYSLTAKATDNLGAVSTSAAIAAISNAAPTVSLTAPANNSSFTAPANITVTADAADTDGTIARVEFYNGTILVGSATSAPYSTTINNLAAGSYSITAQATDNLGAQTTSTAITVISNTLPTVSITSPVANSTVVAPAVISITASAEDMDGTIAKVDFYSGNTLIGSAATAPYAATWSGVPAGSYSLTAIATDNLGLQTTSAAVGITVSPGLQTYYIHTDQLDTPRQITDGNGNVVWQWDNSDPFGNNAANENPTGQGAFAFNLRFPGQYADQETNTYYNINRDYDPSIGRYVESDPIGLAGGSFSTYTYVNSNPLSYVDPFGLNPLILGGGGATSGGLLGGGLLGGHRTNQSSSSITGNSDLDAALNSGNSSQLSTTTDSSGAKVSPDAQCMKPPGNCTPQDQKEMQDEIDQACREPRACSPGMDQVSIQVNISNGLRCALARNRINNKCFAGGDKTHRDEAIRVWNTVAKCQGMAN